MTRSAQDRTLILLRHAKAESGRSQSESLPPESSQPDHDRSLTARGHRDARAAGQWLAGQQIGLDEVWCSTAERTQQTAAGVWAGGCAETDIHMDRRLYTASADQILDVVRETDPDADVVMVVGHAPGIPALTELLTAGTGSAEAHQALGQGFPTCGLAVLHYAGPWSALAFGEASLRRFHICRATDNPQP
ncbi:MAG: SixA phosphatase family protein [Actinomycetota bacterium]